MDAFEQLKLERTQLLSRLSQIEAVLAEHEALRHKVNALLSIGGGINNPVRSQPTKYGTKTESAGRRVSVDVAEFERAIHEILAVSNHPLQRNELYQIALSRNLAVGGLDPLNTLASRMSRMPNVKNIRGQGYWLESRLPELQQVKHGVNEVAPNTDDALPNESDMFK